MRYATWDLAFVAFVLALSVGPSRQPSRSSRRSRHGDGIGRTWVVDVVGGWSEDLDGFGRFFWKILSRQSLQHSFQWMICHELVYVVRYVFFFRFFLFGKMIHSLTNCWRSCTNFSKRFEESILQWIKFFETTQDCSGYKSNCFLAILRFCDLFFEGMELLKTWPFSLVTWWPEGMKRSRLESPGDV